MKTGLPQWALRSPVNDCDLTRARNEQLCHEYNLVRPSHPDPEFVMELTIFWHLDCFTSQSGGFNRMKLAFPIALIMVGALLGGGCATKKYVRQTVDPVSGKLDQVATKSDQQGQTLDQTRSTLDQTRSTQEKDEAALSATNERALSADNHAGQAMSRADEAGKQADQANQGVSDLRNQLATTVANLDDYKQIAGTTVNFKFNSDKLTSDGKMALDQMVTDQNHYKRYFIAVEGFTDKVGGADYNSALSRRRADVVVEYLVAQHDIPIFRIHMVGLGQMKPVEDARSRAANAKNRRVEVTLFSADQNVAVNGPQSSGNSASNPR
jgi:OmpA-OmpF porin, OOP family